MQFLEMLIKIKAEITPSAYQIALGVANIYFVSHLG